MRNTPPRPLSPECFSDAEYMVPIGRPVLATSSGVGAGVASAAPVTTSSRLCCTRWSFDGRSWNSTGGAAGRPRLPSLSGLESTAVDDETVRTPSASSNSTISSDCSAGACVVHERRPLCQPISRQAGVLRRSPSPQRQRWLQDGASLFLKRMESFRQRVPAVASEDVDTPDAKCATSSGSCDHSDTTVHKEMEDRYIRLVCPDTDCLQTTVTVLPVTIETTSGNGVRRRRGGSLRLVRDRISAWRASSSLNMGKDSQKFRKDVQGFLFSRGKKLSQNSMDHKRLDKSSSTVCSHKSLTECATCLSCQPNCQNTSKNSPSDIVKIDVAPAEQKCSSNGDIRLNSDCDQLQPASYTEQNQERSKEQAIVPSTVSSRDHISVHDSSKFIEDEFHTPAPALPVISVDAPQVMTDPSTTDSTRHLHHPSMMSTVSTTEEAGVITVKRYSPCGERALVFSYDRKYSSQSEASLADLNNLSVRSQQTESTEASLNDVHQSSGNWAPLARGSIDGDLSDTCSIGQCSDVSSVHSIASEKFPPRLTSEVGVGRCHSLRVRHPVREGASRVRPSASVDDVLDSLVGEGHGLAVAGTSAAGAGAADCSSQTALHTLSAAQMQRITRHALARLTERLNRYCQNGERSLQWRRVLSNVLLKIRHRSAVCDHAVGSTVFGVSLLGNAQRTGHPLPVRIREALAYLQANYIDQVGIFRKPGVRSRIRRLQQLCEQLPAGEQLPWHEFNAYDIADLVKLYFRQLPEPLLTDKVSHIVLPVYQNVPVARQYDCVQWALLLLPDWHRQALLHLLLFLHRVAAASATNQMTAYNLAVCLVPSLVADPSSPTTVPTSPSAGRQSMPPSPLAAASSPGNSQSSLLQVRRRLSLRRRHKQESGSDADCGASWTEVSRSTESFSRHQSPPPSPSAGSYMGRPSLASSAPSSSLLELVPKTADGASTVSASQQQLPTQPPPAAAAAAAAGVTAAADAAAAGADAAGVTAAADAAAADTATTTTATTAPVTAADADTATVAHHQSSVSVESAVLQHPSPSSSSPLLNCSASASELDSQLHSRAAAAASPAGTPAASPLALPRSQLVAATRSPVSAAEAAVFSGARAGCQCLTSLIERAADLYLLSDSFLTDCCFARADLLVPAALPALWAAPSGRVCDTTRQLIDHSFADLSREMAARSSRHWIRLAPLPSPNNAGGAGGAGGGGSQPSVAVASRKVDDTCPLRLWRCSSEVDAPPRQVMKRLLFDQQLFNGRVTDSRIHTLRDHDSVDICEYTELVDGWGHDSTSASASASASASTSASASDSVAGGTSGLAWSPAARFCVLRAWRDNLARGACSLVSFSIQKPRVLDSRRGSGGGGGGGPGDVSRAGRDANVLSSLYMIEPAGSGRTRVTHFSRVDYRGLSVEWYDRVYGHRCAAGLASLGQSFQLVESRGPESQV